MKLEKGEIVCDECDGVGLISPDVHTISYIYKIDCPKCKGSGKLDWIENLVGKTEKTYIEFDSLSSTNTNGINYSPISINDIEKMYECFGIPKPLFLNSIDLANEEDAKNFTDKLDINKVITENNIKLKDLRKSLEIIENKKKEN